MDTSIAASPAPLRKRLLANPVVRILLAALASLGTMALVLLLSELVPKPMRTAWPVLLAAVGCMLGYRFYVRKVEQRAPLEASGPGVLHELGAGIGIGAALAIGVAGVLLLCGAMQVQGVGDWRAILKPLPEQVLVATFEELVFRAILFRIAEQYWGLRTAVISNVLLFALAHVPNEHVTVLAIVATAVAGAGLLAVYLVTRRVWIAIGMHFAWNYLFDAFLTVPVSGHPARGWIQVVPAGPEWLSGGAYGVEGSLVTVLAWGAAAYVLGRVARQRPQNVLAH
ncbi:CPBP family intramembrane glutamic endopeptidase [Massilia endophytica]|uniref:CPBP family intramembrane glutamic endopeptidase n=1 Tax=Massilia endophytica TaxID=2899220 RepID=UPI001E62D09A|nr:CPBP family intramembrane glutamic endopeptidase [Massilia endophytica]UGQ45559.1 CPBP family intramembrane metalloprotease [Massilia endophytica]